MQTFLPDPDFRRSAQILDTKRLGKQRIEARTILDTLLGRPTKSGKSRKGWINHPAVRMWKGYEEALKLYYNAMVQEWIDRGHKNTMSFEEVDLSKVVMPHWLGEDKVEASHRSNLLRKDWPWYSQFNWDEPDNWPYVWPAGA